MKSIISLASFALILSAQVSLARGITPDNKRTIYNCSSYLADLKGPIVGFALNIYQSTTAGVKTYGAETFPICPVCRVLPSYHSFSDFYLQGTLATYTGPTLEVVIALESLLPTKTHSATVKFLEDGSSRNYTCEAAE